MKGFLGLKGINQDSNWRDVDYCAIDLETTGLDFQKDEIVSLGLVQIRDARVLTQDNLYKEVRPVNAPSHSSVKVHGLRPMDLEAADSLALVLPQFATAMKGRVVIAHAAWIEYAFLKRRFRKAGSSILKNMLDTAALSRATGYAPELNGNEPSLESLARRMNLPVYSPHHALGDAMTTAVMFLALATEIERESIARGSRQLSLKDLLEISRVNSWHPRIRDRMST